MVTAEERKRELDGIIRTMGVGYMNTPIKSEKPVIELLRELTEIKAEMESLPTKGILRTIRKHDEFLSALARDVCRYMDDLIEEYDTHPKPTLEFTKEMYNRVRNDMGLFRRAGLHKNGYLSKTDIDFVLYTAFEQLLLEDLRSREAVHLTKSTVATTAQTNVQHSPESLNQDLQAAPSETEYSEAGVYGTGIRLKAKYTQAEMPKKRKEVTPVVLRRELDPILEQKVLEAWKARGQMGPQLANHTYEATAWYQSSHPRDRRDALAVLVIMEYMTENFGYPGIMGKTN